MVLTEHIIKNSITELEQNNKAIIITSEDTFSEYYNVEGSYNRIYYYPEKINKNHVKNVLLIDEKVKQLINVDFLIHFILKEIDKNALCVCRKIAFIWDDVDGSSTSEVRTKLENLYSDEYAREIGAH